ncbi:MAG: UDP-3-O-acyl-N-acetylglucosamine deacetylase [Akkermansia muciniphila]
MACGNQRTVGSPASLAGTSLHTGQPVTLTLKPAPADFGIKFRRVDIPDQPFISADVEKVQTVERATSLAEGSVKVHTVEHILSALTGMGIDNAVIEMDANEPPIGDGSSAPYVELIKRAGIVELDVPRRYLEVREAVTIETKGGSILTILPSKQFRVSVTCVGPENRITQYFDAVITPETYEKELAPARTFTFYEDIKPLLEKGLIKGGSLENAVVIRGEELMSKEPMRFINEFARHKAMDLIGDLTLCGKPILGHVIAIKPGHGPNTELTAKLKKEHHRNQQMAPNPVNVPYGDAVLDINEVMSLLPHRYPFLMVDRIIGFEGETKCRGLKNRHERTLFPGPLPAIRLPGVLQWKPWPRWPPRHAAPARQCQQARLLQERGQVSAASWFPAIRSSLKRADQDARKHRQATARCLVNGQVFRKPSLHWPSGRLIPLTASPVFTETGVACTAGVFHVPRRAFFT